MLVYLIPLISALIGWFTNFIAVKLLFHPRKAISFGFFKLQGIFPKRQEEIAVQLGKVVAKELLSTKDIQEKILHPDNIQMLYLNIEQKLEDYLIYTLPVKYPVANIFVGDKTRDKIIGEVMDQIKVMTPQMTDELIQKLQDNVDIEKMVYSKVSQFPPEQLENMLGKLMKKEFRFIEWIGAILGFLIGLFQLGLLAVQGQLPSLAPLWQQLTG